MPYQKLLKEGKIKIHHASGEEIKDILEIADRDLIWHLPALGGELGVETQYRERTSHAE